MALIIDMEMPKDCEECPIATVKSYNTWCPLKKCHIKKGYSFKDCPLVELPPHGRLIDAETLKGILSRAPNKGIRNYFFAEVGQFIDEAPTVVEATE